MRVIPLKPKPHHGDDYDQPVRRWTHGSQPRPVLCFHGASFERAAPTHRIFSASVRPLQIVKSDVAVNQNTIAGADRHCLIGASRAGNPVLQDGEEARRPRDGGVCSIWR
jgi:hypothetical protein